MTLRQLLPGVPAVLVAAVVALSARHTPPTSAQDAKAEPKPGDYATAVQPLLKTHCLNCHSAKAKKGSLDLERFATVDDVRKDVKVWQAIVEQVEAGEMPPKEKAQLTEAEKKRLLAWARGFLDAEAKARTGDPGHVPLRRLSNAEYDYTIRDLTGVDLRPAREFPADGAAGEGFTNAAEALADISPALLTKYLNASKQVAEHLVLLPDGFRFSPAKTRRDWTDEGTAKLRAYYAALVPADDGKLQVEPYLRATVRHRDALAAGRFDDAAGKEKLNAKYLRALWAALSAKDESQPLESIRARWRAAAEKDVPALAAEVGAWQAKLWRTVKVGNYIQGSWGAPEGSSYVESLTRQVPVDPAVSASVPLRYGLSPGAAPSEVTLYLAAEELGAGPGGPVVWSRPRFEAPGKPPLLLKDYASYGPRYEADYPSGFASAAKYLAAAAELARDPKATAADLAKRDDLDATFLARWSEVLQLPSPRAAAATRPALPLTPLDEKTTPAPERPAITGWRKKGTDLPVVLANSSDKVENIPGRVSGRTVGVHPTPDEFVAVAWRSPVAGNVTVEVKVAHAHPACGNGVAWWLDHTRGERSTRLGEGRIDLGKDATPPAHTVKVEKGDVLVLAVDPRDGEHTCDMTEVWFTVTEGAKPNRVWNLSADVAPDIQAGNPHADKHGHAGVWSFARGPSAKAAAAPLVAPESVLGQWRAAVGDPARAADAAKLAADAQSLLSGARTANHKSPDRALVQRLVGPDSPLFAGVDVAKVTKPRAKRPAFGLPTERFAADEVPANAGEVVELRVPGALLVGRDFVVDATLGGAADRLARARVAVGPPAGGVLDGPLVGSAAAPAYKRLTAGSDAFRRVFPLYLCFPQVVPTDEVVTLKRFHREDEPLTRLFLSDAQTRELDRMWAEQRFVSRQPVAEWEYLPQFMEYTTQDTPKALQQFFIDRKPLFKAQAEAFVKEEAAAIPKQVDALLEFASRAYRRPLGDKEKADLRTLYDSVRGKGASHEEAFRGVLSRVLVAPAFLFRIEAAPAGKQPGPVNDHELATRLSYFLWASLPDDELRGLAAANKLHEPAVLAGQVRRMLKDARARALAVEFGTQWLHVRGFEAHNEKNEALFPTFTPELRKAMDEEGVLLFLDLFQQDRPVSALLDADHTHLNEALARHYGIPGVSGPQFRKVEGVRKFGRGGVLGLGSVQAMTAGASRTSPVLRGNWVSETLLGEKLPKPPPNVPQLPEVEGANKLTVRQLVERHASDQACAVCHVRIDPFGFAFERYDPIGRLRDKDLGGMPVDTKAKLKDGTEFDGLDGLRGYLLAKKKDVVMRLFCKRLLGYALGRSVTLSDTALLDEMVSELDKHEGRVGAAVGAIVRSKQFRMVRGSEFEE